ncbi:Uncharacterised protein [Burkholderia pseudomallei]|nr:Uncharacterised protein [Burkholderia pseudomallei]
MIDQDKMRALVSETRHMADIAVELGWNGCAEHFTECADAIDHLLAEVEAAKREAAHWKANHDNQVARARVLIERTDMPLERVDAYKLIGTLRDELEAAAADKRNALAFRDLMAAVIRNINHGEYNRPYRGIENAPGHAHDRPGIWDSDNGAKAGTQCAWCATWNAARAALAQRQGE